MSHKKVRFFKVTQPDFGQRCCIYKSPEAFAEAELTDSETGDVFHVEVAEMTEDEFDKLPEFEGW